MRAIQIGATVAPNRTMKSRLFGLVEGDIFSYRAAVNNVGEEPVGAKQEDADGRGTRLTAIEFAWSFTSGQVVVKRFPFPDLLAPSTSYTFPDVEHRILSPGFALLSVRLWWTGRGFSVQVLDNAGQTVPLPETDYVRDYQAGAGTVYLVHSFAAFRAKSRGEVYQSILLLVAIIALLVNTAVAVYTIFK